MLWHSLKNVLTHNKDIVGTASRNLTNGNIGGRVRLSCLRSNLFLSEGQSFCSNICQPARFIEVKGFDNNQPALLVLFAKRQTGSLWILKNLASDFHSRMVYSFVADEWFHHQSKVAQPVWWAQTSSKAYQGLVVFSFTKPYVYTDF